MEIKKWKQQHEFLTEPSSSSPNSSVRQHPRPQFPSPQSPVPSPQVLSQLARVRIGSSLNASLRLCQCLCDGQCHAN